MARILVVEDDHSLRTDIMELLELENYEVVGAANGTEGVDFAYEYQPDLILCDMRMPGLHGDEVERQVRQFLGHVPFIFLTGTDFSETKLNQANYLSKPFRAETLLEMIAQKLEH